MKVKVLVFMVLVALFSPLISAESLNINTATEEQIAAMLDGVGQAKAKAIIEDREANGSFKSIEDLTRVKGIGPVIVEKNRDKIKIE